MHRTIWRLLWRHLSFHRISLTLFYKENHGLFFYWIVYIEFISQIFINKKQKLKTWRRVGILVDMYLNIFKILINTTMLLNLITFWNLVPNLQCHLNQTSSNVWHRFVWPVYKTNLGQTFDSKLSVSVKCKPDLYQPCDTCIKRTYTKRLTQV